MFIGTYWAQREETRESSAQRIAKFIKTLSSSGEEFSVWFKKGRSRAAAMLSPINTDAISIERELTVSRGDFDRKLISELGFSFAAWNGRDTSLSATVGSWGNCVMNAVILDLGREQPDNNYRSILENMIAAFEPDHGVVTTYEWLPKSRGTRPWEVGLFTFHRGGVIEKHIVPTHTTK